MSYDSLTKFSFLLTGLNFNMPLGQIFTFILSLAFVIVMAIWTTRFVATQRFRSTSKNLQIVESLGIGGQSSICIIKVGTKYCLVGITKEGVRYLSDVNEDDINLELMTNNRPVDFTNVLSKYLKKDDSNDKL